MVHNKQEERECGRKLKIGVYSMDGIGHISAAIGVMQPLIERGHDVFFIANKEFTGKFLRYGTREHILVKNLSPEQEAAEASAAKAAGQRLLTGGWLSNIAPIEKIRAMKGWQSWTLMIDKILLEDPLIEKIIVDEKPDVMLVDHIVLPPVFVKVGVPFVMIHSPSPLFVYDDERLPPAYSGFSPNGDRSQWPEFRALSQELFFGKLREIQRKVFDATQVEMPDTLRNVFMSPYLNVYAYPKELDYSLIVPLPEKVFRIDAFSRAEPTTEEFKLPDEFLQRPPGQALIYLSMGSMGGADVELMKKLTSYIAGLKHKFVLVKGPRGDEYTVDSPNIFADNFLPQTAIIPLCDLVITHGGNNSTTETFFAGKPMIVMPLFADQYDNATQVEECGFGRQFNPHDVTQEQLGDAIDDLLGDDAVRARLDAAMERMKTDNSKLKLAITIENIAQEHCERK